MIQYQRGMELSVDYGAYYIIKVAGNIQDRTGILRDRVYAEKVPLQPKSHSSAKKTLFSQKATVQPKSHFLAHGCHFEQSLNTCTMKWHLSHLFMKVHCTCSVCCRFLCTSAKRYTDIGEKMVFQPRLQQSFQEFHSGLLRQVHPVWYVSWTEAKR